MTRPKRERKKVEVAIHDESEDGSADDSQTSPDKRDGIGRVDSGSGNNAADGNSSEAEDEPGEGDDDSPSTDAGEPWSVKWTKASGNCWAQDKHGDWYEAKIVDVIAENDPRKAQITEENLKNKRSLKARASRLADFSMTEGDWVRVHFQGWSPNHDEWMHFIRGGFVCTQDRKVCFCARHLKGLKATRQRGSGQRKILGETVATGQATPRRSSGRPAGSKNKKTLEAEASESSIMTSIVDASPVKAVSPELVSQADANSAAFGPARSISRRRSSGRSNSLGEAETEAQKSDNVSPLAKAKGSFEEPKSNADKKVPAKKVADSSEKNGEIEQKTKPASPTAKSRGRSSSKASTVIEKHPQNGNVKEMQEPAMIREEQEPPSAPQLSTPRDAGETPGSKIRERKRKVELDAESQSSPRESFTSQGDNKVEDLSSVADGVTVLSAEIADANEIRTSEAAEVRRNTEEAPMDMPSSIADHAKSDEVTVVTADVPSVRSGAFTMEPSKILKLDENGIPLGAIPVLDYAKELQWSVEKLLKTADVGTLNTACRWWFKGEKLLRPAVLQGAAKLVEWYEATKEGRPRRPVRVDLAAATQYKQTMDAEMGYSAQYQAELERKLQKKAKLMSPPDVAGDQASGPSSRRSGALGENGMLNVRLLPSTGKWESSIALAPNRPLQRIGLFDSSEIATAAVKRAHSVVERMSKEFKEQAMLQERSDNCPACGNQIVGDALRQCSLCPKRYHVTCVSWPNLIVDRDPSLDWICPICEYELMKTAIAVGGSTTTTVSLVRPSFAPDTLNSSSSTAGNAAIVASGQALSTSKVRKTTSASGAASFASASKRSQNSTGGQLRFEDEIKYLPSNNPHTDWVGVPYLTPPHRVAERKVFFSGFSRTENRNVQFRVLDHILIGRRGSAIGEDVEEEQKNSPDFFVGQIEALWEDRQTGERFMRIAWFFWPEETDHNIESFKHVGEGVEIMTSFETDVEHITRAIAKTKVLSQHAFDEYQQEQREREAAEQRAAEEEMKRLEVEEKLMREATIATQESSSSAEHSQLNGDTANAESPSVPVITSNRPKHLRECPRCGMWGFRTAGELGAHSGRFCGEDTPEALQKRRAEWGREIATGDEVPTPMTKDVGPKPRPVRDSLPGLGGHHPNSTPSKRGDFDDVEDDVMMHPLVVERARARASKGPFFARLHYHQRENRLDCQNDEDTANNEAQSSLIYSTREQPVTEYWAHSELKDQLSCVQGVHMEEPGHEESERRCGFCWTAIESTDVSLLCTECPDLHLCIPCVRAGRQGQACGRVSPKHDFIGLEGEQRFHRVTHAYKVRPATIDPTNPADSPRVLAKICGLLGLGDPVYELLEISRAPSAARASRRPRFRAGVHVAGLSAALCAEEFGFTMEQAEAQAAFTALRTFFGGTHRFALPIARSKWSCWEAARLMDAMHMHGLAWETVAPIVGTKDATHCRLFFSEHLAPPSVSTTTSAEQPSTTADVRDRKPMILAVAGSDGKPILDLYDEEAPSMLLDMVSSEAIEWSSRVVQWRKRRAEGRTGLLFAVVDGSIIRLPDSTTYAQHPSTECKYCGKATLGGDKMRCAVCEDMFHPSCALQLDPAAATTPRDEWYCPTCLEDEKYVYEDSCWGASGKLLCALADRIQGSSSVGDWEFNSLIIAEATRMAQSIVRQQQDGDIFSESADSRSGPKRPTSTPGVRKRVAMSGEDEEKKKAMKKLKESQDEVVRLREENKLLKRDLQKITAERDELRAKIEVLTAKSEERLISVEPVKVESKFEGEGIV